MEITAPSYEAAAENQAANISPGPGAEETEQPIAALRVERSSAPAVTTSIPSLLRAGSGFSLAACFPASASGRCLPQLLPALSPVPAAAAAPGEAGRARKHTWAKAWVCPRGGESPTLAGLSPREHSPARPRFLDLTHGFPEPQTATRRQALDGLRKGRIGFGLLFEGKNGTRPRHGCPYSTHVHMSVWCPYTWQFSGPRLHQAFPQAEARHLRRIKTDISPEEPNVFFISG